MTNRKRSIDGSSGNSNNEMQSDITSGVSKHKINMNKALILNPSGMNSPVNALHQDDFEINRELQDKLM